MPVPPNLTPATALDVGALPFTATISAADLTLAPTGSNGRHEVWFQYTHTDASVVMLGLWAGAPIADNYQPVMTVFTGTALSLTPEPFLPGSLANIPAQIPPTVSTTYFFQIVNGNSTDPLTGGLTLNGQSAPQLASSAGALLVPDHATNNAGTASFPAVVLDLAGNVIKQFIAFPACEMAEVLPVSGIILAQNSITELFDLYSGTVTLTTAGLNPLGYSVSFPVITSDQVDTFYVGQNGSGGNAKVTTVSHTGVTGATTWTLAFTSIFGIAVSPDESTLYYIGNVQTVIHRWDLVNDVALTDLAAAVPNYHLVHDIIVLSDGTLLVGYTSGFAGHDDFVRQYSAAGATIADLSVFGASADFALIRMCHAIDDPTSFITWVAKSSDATTTYAERLVSDGSVVHARTDETQFEQGVYEDIPSDTPQRFGNSDSCPMFILRQALPAQGGSTGTIIVMKTTPTILGTTVSFPFGATGGLSPSSFALTTGTSETFTGVPAGSGYGVFETAPDGWTVSYTVSNGSPIDNLTVGADETVTVTAANVPTAVGITDPIRRLRQMPHLSDRQLWQFFASFQLDMENGLGLSTGQGSDPQIMLSWSDDGGHTWSAERWVSAGMQGQYTARAIWRRLGRSRDRVWRIVVSDPVPWRINQALISVSEGTS